MTKVVSTRGFYPPGGSDAPTARKALLEVGGIVVSGAGRGVAIPRGDGAQWGLPGLGQSGVLGLRGNGVRGVVTSEGLEAGLDAGGGESGQDVSLPAVLNDGDKAGELLVGNGKKR